MNIRINSIGAEQTAYLGKKPEDALYNISIVKYHPNRYYGELENYINNGWEDCGDFVKDKDYKGTISIDKKCFEGKETSYVVAFLKYDKKEGVTELTSVGDRLLYIEAEDKKDFWEVYKIADRKLTELFDKHELADFGLVLT
jgi:Golgi nucleoside diphosphatase